MEHDENYLIEKSVNDVNNECPEKDKDGNCLTPGVFSDSDPIGGG
ncbi:hypothetical protein [Anaerovorax sp. IOR16]|nr:hypothetical protein [Anaerovorax sp. IOR16]